MDLISILAALVSGSLARYMMVPTRPIRKMFRAPFHRNLTRPTHVDWMLQEPYDAILFSGNLRGSPKGFRIFVSLVVKQEPVRVFLFKNSGFQIVPLLVFFKPIHTEVSFWSEINSQENAQRVEETIQPVQPVRPVLNGKQMIHMNATHVDSEEEMLSDKEEMFSDKEEEVAPVRPVRPVLNGKQMIRMNAPPPACFLKDRRKNPNPERAKPQKRVGFYMCRPCCDTIIVETNGKLTSTLCFECKRKNF